jgi:hypothetical protein
MATTPTYSWPIPDNTDLVKDGAEAIRDLGNAIDTTVGGLSGAGLVHIETQSPSAVSGVSFNDVFSSTYESYKIVYSIIPTISTLQFRLRNAGSDVSTNDYYWHAAVTLSNNTGYGTAQNGNGVSSFSFSASNVGNTRHHGFIDILNPADAIKKGLVGMGVKGRIADSAGGQFLCGIDLATAHDGFTFFVGSGTLTGSISVYGYKK